MLPLGRYRLAALETGSFALDGGALFGLPFAHDPEVAAGRLGEKNGQPVFREAVAL
jgi:hypothetical protein